MARVSSSARRARRRSAVELHTKSCSNQPSRACSGWRGFRPERSTRSRRVARRLLRRRRRASRKVKVGKSDDVWFSKEVRVGELTLKARRYRVQHRVEGPDHFRALRAPGHDHPVGPEDRRRPGRPRGRSQRCQVPSAAAGRRGGDDDAPPRERGRWPAAQENPDSRRERRSCLLTGTPIGRSGDPLGGHAVGGPGTRARRRSRSQRAERWSSTRSGRSCGRAACPSGKTPNKPFLLRRHTAASLCAS